MEGQRSNQLNYVPTLFSPGYRETRIFTALPCCQLFRLFQPVPPHICEILHETDTMDTMDTMRNRDQSICPCSTNQIVTEDSQIAGSSVLSCASQTKLNRLGIARRKVVPLVRQWLPPDGRISSRYWANSWWANSWRTPRGKNARRVPPRASST
jgi:hypothetical protein